MIKVGKWIGGGLGWTFMGPVGGIVGFLIGAMIDMETGTKPEPPKREGRTTQNDFMMNLLVLIAAVLKANGKVMRSELTYVKAYLLKVFGKDKSTLALKTLRDLLKKNIQVREVCLQMRGRLDYSSKLELLHFLMGIIAADNVIDDQELRLVEFIARNLGILEKDLLSIKSMFIKPIDWAYKILELDKKCTNEEVKRAYRRMAMKYHPDKVSYLGDGMRKDAEAKFKKVNEAYEEIKSERNIL